MIGITDDTLVAALRTYKPTATWNGRVQEGIEFVYDPTTRTFAVGRPEVERIRDRPRFLSPCSNNCGLSPVASAAGNNLNITAKGAGQDSDIKITGSNVKAGNDAALKADGDILLQAAQSTSEQKSDSKSSSAGVGVYVSMGSNTGFGLTANASTARGNADGNDLVHTNTHVKAGNKITLASGSDTTLKGAVVGGKKE